MSLRVLTFNIRCDMGQDGPNNWEHRRDRALKVMKEAAADIIAVQEAVPGQRADLEQSLTAYTWLGRGRDTGGGGEQCAIGVGPALRILEEGTFWLSSHPDKEGVRDWDAMLPRICTWARLAMGEVEFVVGNAHLDHHGRQAREKSADLLRASFSDARSILVGDFNCSPEERPVEILKEGFQESFGCLHPDSRQATYHEFGAVQDGPRIDYVFAGSTFEVKQAEILAENGPPWSSDHFPVLVELELSVNEKRLG